MDYSDIVELDSDTNPQVGTPRTRLGLPRGRSDADEAQCIAGGWAGSVGSAAARAAEEEGLV